jgi:tetratricopeptide (TPR) repeat protein
MRIKLRTFYRTLILLVGGLLAATQLQAQVPTNSSQRDQLQQLTTQLQNSPNDEALREKIIALALTLSPKPATPIGATQAEGAAEYAFKNAKTNSDYSDAAKQYEKALLLAPWLAADYFNCGVAHEKAGENKEAIRSFNLYLLAAPNADDAQAVNKRIGGLQYAEQRRVSDDEAKARETARELAAAQARAQLAIVWTDPNSGLMWAKKDNGFNITQAQASAYCLNLNLAGFRDWRLPKINELLSIFDPSADTGNGYGRHIKGDIQPSSLEWSSTPGKGSDKALAFDFGGGHGAIPEVDAPSVYLTNSVNLRALCVRRAVS